jgi:hypothetical protein
MSLFIEVGPENVDVDETKFVVALLVGKNWHMKKYISRTISSTYLMSNKGQIMLLNVKDCLHYSVGSRLSRESSLWIIVLLVDQQNTVPHKIPSFVPIIPDQISTIGVVGTRLLEMNCITLWNTPVAIAYFPCPSACKHSSATSCGVWIIYKLHLRCALVRYFKR